MPLTVSALAGGLASVSTTGAIEEATVPVTLHSEDTAAADEFADGTRWDSLHPPSYAFQSDEYELSLQFELAGDSYFVAVGPESSEGCFFLDG